MIGGLFLRSFLGWLIQRVAHWAGVALRAGGREALKDIRARLAHSDHVDRQWRKQKRLAKATAATRESVQPPPPTTPVGE